MRRKILTFVVAALACTALIANAGSEHKHGEHKDKAKAASAKATGASFSGEIVDTGCYLGHEAKGEKHASCAAKCISNGMPMGLLTADGTLYLLTPDHDSPDAYNALKDMAAKMVTVNGTKMERAGMMAINVTGYKAMAAGMEHKEAPKKGGY